MKKILFILGLGGLGYGAYYFITKQLELALNWDFKVKDLKVNSITTKGADFDVIVSVLNKSSFALEVKDYDIDLIYSGAKIAKAINDNPFIVQGDSWFDVPTSAFVSFDSAKGILGKLGSSLLGGKPINVTVQGKMNILIGGLTKEILFNAKDILVTQDGASDLGLSKPINKINNLLDKLGIKI